MKVFTNINEICLKDAVVSIGFFDGLHVGHKYVIQMLKEVAAKQNKNELLITIWPHPAFVFGRSIKLLNTLDEKIKLIEEAGVQNLLILDFTKELASYSFKNFINEILVKKLSTSTILMGFDNSFGNKNATEDTDITINDNITIERISEVKSDYYASISSSTIRESLLNGNIEMANQMLGYNYFIDGEIVGGHKIGRQIGFPTANVAKICEDKLIPANGVYIVKVIIDNKIYIAMLCIGVRPSFGEHKRSIEFNIIDFCGDLYGKNVRILFYEKIREEIKFGSIDDLVSELHNDKIKTIKYFKNK